MSSDQEVDVNEYSEGGDNASSDSDSASSDSLMSVDNVQSYNWLDDQNGDFYRDKQARRSLATIPCNLGISLNDTYALEFFKSLNPNFTFRQDVVNSDCLKLYNEEKDRIKQLLRNLDGDIHVSLEVLAYGYPLVKVHFIDKNWNSKSWILRFGCGDNDEDTIEGSITSSLSEFEIWNKVSTLTVKRDSLYDEIFDGIKKSVHEKKQLPLNGQLFHIHCCADLLTSMVEGAYKEIKKSIEKVSELVCMGKSSYSWDHTYQTLKEGLKFESEGKWNDDSYNDFEKLTAEEWKKVEDICRIVGYVHELAKVLFEKENPTANIYFHAIQFLREKLAEEGVSSDSFCGSVAKKMILKFDKYWKDNFLVLAIAAVLDPRLKMKGIEFFTLESENTQWNNQASISTVLEAIRSLCDSYKTNANENTEKIESASDSCASDEESASGSFTRKQKKSKESPNKHNELMSRFLKFTESEKSKLRKEELDLYLEEPVFPWGEVDILSWWKNESGKYPTLSKVARGILGIPISLLKTHNAFLTTEREISSVSPDQEFDSKLKNALMCTRSWSKGRSG